MPTCFEKVLYQAIKPTRKYVIKFEGQDHYMKKEDTTEKLKSQEKLLD